MSARAEQQAEEGPWSIEFDALARATGGAVLFGIPLLFTMEMWWIGEYRSRPHLLGFLALAFLANTALARLSGFRSDVRPSLRREAAEAIEAMGVGTLTSFVVLVSLGQVDVGTSLYSLAGMVAVQVVPLSLGATVGNLVFDPETGRAGDGDTPARSPLWELLNDVSATFAGALFLGFAIAPTEEIPMIAAGLTLLHVFALVFLTLFASYLIVFASGFDPSHRGRHVGGLFQRPFSETMLSYVVSLAAALVLLYGFGQIELGDPLYWTLTQMIVLGVPAAIGGAAGRVVV